MLAVAIFSLIEKNNYKFKANHKNANFPRQFCPESISEEFDYADS